jgi:chemotaxis response regulator CheB
MGNLRRSHQRKQAVESARVLHPDVVVLDISMPVMSALVAALGLPSLAWDAES